LKSYEYLFSLKVTDYFSHPYEATAEIAGFIFSSSGSSEADEMATVFGLNNNKHLQK
jgi:hypothetical protein